MRSVIFVFIFLLHLATTVAIAEDISGSKDHPLLTRYPDARISEYSKNYNAVTFTLSSDSGGAPEQKSLEGDMTSLRYYYKDLEHQPSPLQLIRNYQNAIKAIGGSVLFERLPSDGDGGETTLKVSSGGKEIWVKVVPEIYSAPTQSYKLEIVEIAAMQQVVSANQLLDELNSKGFATLYINFDTGKWDLKTESRDTTKEIAAMLKLAPDLKISVEGHTDNVGSPDANKELSENRAKSVVSAIAQDGIEPDRLKSKGFGQDKPIADNRSEEGRAKNRRVELVKLST